MREMRLAEVVMDVQCWGASRSFLWKLRQRGKHVGAEQGRKEMFRCQEEHRKKCRWPREGHWSIMEVLQRSEG